MDAISSPAPAVVDQLTQPPPRSRRAARRDARIEARTARAIVPRHGGTGSSPAIRMLAWGLVSMLALGVLAVVSGVVSIGSAPGGGPADVRGRDLDGSWSYYHDRDYDTQRSGGAKWDIDRSRSSDPDEAVLGDTSRWEYDGPYRYGPYGSDGMRRRAAGRESRDPLYSQPAPIQDVFRTYGGDLDPSGGQPVGVAPSSMTNPYYDPYGGYSNPYANRIRLGYGEGVGRGASYDPMVGG